MTQILAIVLLLTALLLGLGMFVQGVRYRVEILSTRNFFLLGVLFFQLFSAGIALWLEDYGQFGVNRPFYAGLIFTLIILPFLAVFLLTYRWGPVVRWLAGKVPVTYAPSGPFTMLILAMTFFVVGVLMRVVLTQIPILGVLTGMLGTGMFAAAAGMATWAWVPRLWNPFVALIAIAIILLCVATSMYGTFGRRDTMNVILACGWAAYFSSWRYYGVPKALFRLTTVAAFGVVVLGLFSASRGAEGKGRTPIQAIVDMSQASVGEGVQALISTQDAGSLSMWVCDNRPQPFPYDTLHQGRYFLTHAVPRQFMPSKPEALGRIMVDQKKQEGVDTGFTVGPGLVGHIMNDNPWIALLPYAFFLGLTFRFMDQVIANHVQNPFIVLPLGVAMGEFFGTPRGESALFFFVGLVSCMGAWICMAFSAKLLQMIGMRLDAGTVLPYGWEDEPAELADSETVAVALGDDGSPRVN
jgi:hypothetical protein